MLNEGKKSLVFNPLINISILLTDSACALKLKRLTDKFDNKSIIEITANYFDNWLIVF